jgi:acyl carrier protein
VVSVSRQGEDIFEIVRNIIAIDLGIDAELVDRHFRFHHFIDRLAVARQIRSNTRTSTDYIEAVNIYIDMSERFDINLFTEFTSSECVTVEDLVAAIEQKLNTK